MAMPPSSPPRPYQSPLWPHLEEIKRLVKARKTWMFISEYIRAAHGLSVHHATVCKFYNRWRKRRIELPPQVQQFVAPKKDEAPTRTFNKKSLDTKTLTELEIAS